MSLHLKREEIPVESYFYCLFISVDLIRQLRDTPLGICGEPLQQVFRRLRVFRPSATNDVLKNNKSNQNYMKSFIFFYVKIEQLLPGEAIPRRRSCWREVRFHAKKQASSD